MERDQVITLNPVSHPDRRVRQVGFGLTDPYVEQCWSAVVGPSTTLLLRRLPELWREHQPAQIEASELGRSLGLSASMAKHSHQCNLRDQFHKTQGDKHGPPSTFQGPDPPFSLPRLTKA